MTTPFFFALYVLAGIGTWYIAYTLSLVVKALFRRRRRKPVPEKHPWADHIVIDGEPYE